MNKIKNKFIKNKFIKKFSHINRKYDYLYTLILYKIMYNNKINNINFIKRKKIKNKKYNII